MSAVQDASAVQLKDPSGTVVATLDGGLAHDSATTPVAGAETPVTVSLTSVAKGPATLSVSISSTWLSNPARVFPVVIDPFYFTPQSSSCPDIAASKTGGSPYGSCATYVNSDNYYADPGYSDQTQLRTGSPGLSDEYVSGQLNRTRSFIQFPTDDFGSAPFDNYLVVSATMSIDTYAGSGADGLTDLYGMGEYFGSLTNWANQPGGTDPADAGSDGYGVVDQEDYAGGQGYVGFNVTSLVQRWFDGAEPNYGLELVADNEFDTSDFRQYYSANAGYSVAPMLTVTYETPPTPPPSYQGSISAGEFHSLAAKGDGSVYAWGANNDGQLGNATTNNSSVPVQVPGLSDVVAVSAGGYHSLALTSQGTVYAWGYNSNGQLGNGTTNNSDSPVQVPGLSAIVAISGGFSSSYALRADGTVFAWGANASGRLGNGTTTDSHSPVQVPGLSNVVAISAGYAHALALTSGTTIYAWGDNNDGQLGNNTTTNEATPQAIASGVDAVAAGEDVPLSVEIGSGDLSWQSYFMAVTGSVHGWVSQSILAVPTVELALARGGLQ